MKLVDKITRALISKSEKMAKVNMVNRNIHTDVIIAKALKQ